MRITFMLCIKKLPTKSTRIFASAHTQSLPLSTNTKNDWQAANTLSGSSWQSSWILSPESWFCSWRHRLILPPSPTRLCPHAFDTFLRGAICRRFPALSSQPVFACAEAFGRTDCWRFDFGQRALPLDAALPLPLHATPSPTFPNIQASQHPTTSHWNNR